MGWMKRGFATIGLGVSLAFLAAPAYSILRTDRATKRLRSRPRVHGLAIHADFRVTDVRGLERKHGTVSPRLREAVSGKQFRECFASRGEINLVVIHTTEHLGSTFENTAEYIRRERLANYLIASDGGVYEIVPEKYRAYGCGDSVWEGHYTVDLEAINIEIYANTAPGEHHSRISKDQYKGLKALLIDIRARRHAIDRSRIVTHRMVALNYKTEMRSRKGDPYEFDWKKAGLSDNSQILDPDVLRGRAKLCTDERYIDRVTFGQIAAARMMQMPGQRAKAEVLKHGRRARSSGRRTAFTRPSSR